MKSSILIIDDEESICQILTKFYNSKGYSTYVAHDGAGGVEIVSTISIDLVLLDLRLPDRDGLEVLQSIKSASPVTAVIIVTAYGDVETAVRAMQKRADNFILKPVDLGALETLTEKTLEKYRTQAEVHYLKRKVSRLEGSSSLDNLRQPPDVYHAIRLLADNSSTNVLLLGETGTGKGMVANAIHELSERKENPFMDINCAGLSAELLESELFGHEKGAFTDAKAFKKGLLEVASGGSVFLDEIGELSSSVQAKLLKVIEQKQFRRLGGTANIEVDVRIMAATNVDLEDRVNKDMFRKDLFYRLNVMPVKLPPLRERPDDVMPLAETFLNEFNQNFGKGVEAISPEAESMLAYYSWPGNIRELKNVIERAVLLCEGREVTPAHLPDNLKQKNKQAAPPAGGQWSLEEMEKEHIRNALYHLNHNHSQVARVLGIHRSTLIKKIKKYGLET